MLISTRLLVSHILIGIISICHEVSLKYYLAENKAPSG